MITATTGLWAKLLICTHSKIIFFNILEKHKLPVVNKNKALTVHRVERRKDEKYIMFTEVFVSLKFSLRVCFYEPNKNLHHRNFVKASDLLNLCSLFTYEVKQKLKRNSVIRGLLIEKRVSWLYSRTDTLLH